jgi:hypothetical protein
MNIDTRTIENFLNSTELSIIENHVKLNCQPWENWNPADNESGKIMSSYYYVFNYYSETNKLIKDILQPKLDKEFGPDLHIQQIHIFDSFDPYKIHSDVDSAGEFPTFAPYPAWTFIIPLFDVESYTIVFNEQNNLKEPEYYFKKTKPFNSFSIDLITYKKYFSHIPYSYFRWLSIEDIFKWRKGSLFAASRYKFHTSDNFLANGVSNKRAIIAWTSLPNNV